MAHTMKKATTAQKAKTAPAGDGRVHKPFDELQFAEDWAEGRLRQRDLAERYGLSLSTVKKITCGQRRPRIAEMIQAARQEARDRCERRLTRLLETATATLERVMLEGPASAAVAAAREVLRRALDAPKAAEAEEAKRKTKEKPPRPTGPWELTISPETRRKAELEFGKDLETGEPIPGWKDPYGYVPPEERLPAAASRAPAPSGPPEEVYRILAAPDESLLNDYYNQQK